VFKPITILLLTDSRNTPVDSQC